LKNRPWTPQNFCLEFFLPFLQEAQLLIASSAILGSRGAF
jgi:hypothetical protein